MRDSALGFESDPESEDEDAAEALAPKSLITAGALGTWLVWRTIVPLGVCSTLIAEPPPEAFSGSSGVALVPPPRDFRFLVLLELREAMDCSPPNLVIGGWGNCVIYWVVLFWIWVG